MENKKKIAQSFNYVQDFGASKGNLCAGHFDRKQNPELIEKFYKQIINSFGYAHSAKL